MLLEQNVNSPTGQRYNRWWAAYGAGGSVYLPLVMADSGHEYGSGPVSYYPVYKGYLDAELARPAGAEIDARAWRTGNRYRVSLTLVNRSGVALSSANAAAVHVIVYEDIKAGVTSRMVRDAVFASVISTITDGGRASFVLDTHDLRLPTGRTFTCSRSPTTGRGDDGRIRHASGRVRPATGDPGRRLHGRLEVGRVVAARERGRRVAVADGRERPDHGDVRTNGV